MTNQQIRFELTPGLIKEIQHLEQENPNQYFSLEELHKKTDNSSYQGTVLELNSRLSPNSTLIDVGCGYGETSLLLASLGHKVHSIEPSSNRCRALQESSKQIGLSIHTYLCSGEAIDKISLPGLDGCLFFSSLHHCDDPLKTLKNVKQILKPRGLIVLNEPILRFYRTKSWFHQQLKDNPVKMGHYGGNEHIYYFKEYYKLLESAGFENIQFCWANKRVDPRNTLISDLSSKFYGHYQHSTLRCFVKYGVHRTVKAMSERPLFNSLIVSPLLRISLLQAVFIAHAKE